MESSNYLLAKPKIILVPLEKLWKCNFVDTLHFSRSAVFRTKSDKGVATTC
jgi:hypothetical protein